uniref:Peptidase S1 domain-containing protein n=1 Tax=Knipowitschia caucasica TaxID=637954 RepID=A0AAV2LFL2_KNICA
MAVAEIWVFLIFFTQISECGEAPLNTRIVGGENAVPGSWPWQVSVHLNGAHICGATVISTDWVLTAAHCILSPSASAYTLYFGKQTQSGSNPHEETRPVSQIIVHADYNSTTFNNDIALMKLSSSISYSDYIKPVCLASSSSLFHNSTSCWGTGWGRLSKDEPLVAHDVLQEVQIPVIGNQMCSCSYLKVENASITSNMLCAGELGKGICQGDSGGPVQCKQGTKWIQAGISSFGIPCAIGFPEVFARVSAYQVWITGQVSGASISFVEFTSSGTDPDSSFRCLNSTAAPNAAASTDLPFCTVLLMVLLQPLLA